jgi:hypothetical protein
MSPVSREWLAVVLFLVSFGGLSATEALWIRRARWTTLGKAAIFSLGTNFFGFCVGLFTSFVILSIILAMAWDGSIHDVPGHDTTLWAAMIAALFITPVLLVIIKRLLLWFLKWRTGIPAWIFSFAASILIFFVSLGLPAVVLYFV